MPLFFLFGDYQGSAQLMMSNEADPASANVQRSAYTPHGAEHDFDPDGSAGSASAKPLTIERGRWSQVADEATSSLGTGLTYLNARYYDSVASRFISPDPLLDVMDPKTLDPYRYAENNPVFYTDASGLRAIGQYDCSGQGCEKTNSGKVQANPNNAADIKAAIEEKKRLLWEQLESREEEQWQDIKSTYDSNWKVAGLGAVNYGVGFVNSGADLINFAVDYSPIGMGLHAFGVNTEIPDIGIVGDYDLYRWSAYSGSAGFETALTAATFGVADALEVGRGATTAFRGASQAAPGGQRGAAVTLNGLKQALGRKGMGITGYDISYAPRILDAFGNLAHGATSFVRGRAAIRISDLGLSSMENAVTTVFHEVYHANTFVRTGLQGAEEAAEAFGKSMWAKFVAAG